MHVRRQTGAIVVGSSFLELGVARSLGRHGIPVWVLADRNSLAAWSRFSRRRLPWPTDPERQIALLLALPDRYGLRQWTLYATGDEQVALVARHHAALAERFVLTTASWEQYRWAYDKRLTYQLAAQLGVDYPWTRVPRDKQELALLDCPFPAILKPAFKQLANPFTDAKAWRVASRRELLDRYDAACALVPPEIVMVQESIPGQGEAQFSFAALCREGTPVAWLTARRARQYPPDFGLASTYVETVESPPIEKAARRLLKAIGLSGLVEVEFKYDRASGRYLLLDINARAWAWHTLGRRAGVDFPYLLWRMVHDLPIPNLKGRAGVRWIHLIPDLESAILSLRRGDFHGREWLGSLCSPRESAVFALDDPLPALVEAPLLLKQRFLRK